MEDDGDDDEEEEEMDGTYTIFYDIIHNLNSL